MIEADPADPTDQFLDLVARFAAGDTDDLLATVRGIAQSGTDPDALALRGAIVASKLAEMVAGLSGRPVGEVLGMLRMALAADAEENPDRPSSE